MWRKRRLVYKDFLLSWSKSKIIEKIKRSIKKLEEAHMALENVQALAWISEAAIIDNVNSESYFKFKMFRKILPSVMNYNFYEKYDLQDSDYYAENMTPEDHEAFENNEELGVLYKRIQEEFKKNTGIQIFLVPYYSGQAIPALFAKGKHIYHSLDIDEDRQKIIDEFEKGTENIWVARLQDVSGCDLEKYNARIMLVEY